MMTGRCFFAASGVAFQRCHGYNSDMHYLFSALAAFVISFFPSFASAGIGGIGNATVKEGVFATHLRSSYHTDDSQTNTDGRWRSRIMTDYGFTDNFALGLYLQGDNRPGDNLEMDALMLDARIELTEAKDTGFYSGLRLRYTFKDGDKKPDNAHVRFILGAPVGKWDFRINQILAYEIGQQSRGGLGIDTRLQTTYNYADGHRAGIESFSDFGYGSRNSDFDQQNHTIGPIFAGKLADNLSYETGYRYGLSDAAADHTFKLFVVHSF